MQILVILSQVQQEHNMAVKRVVVSMLELILQCQPLLESSVVCKSF